MKIMIGLRLILIATGLWFGAAASWAADPVYATSGIAIRGYDPVAYFTDGKPVRGKAEFSHMWNGATWQFASAEHREMFKADPAKYAPQYGGYCAYGASLGYQASTEPTAWRIVDGKLYLNHNADIQKTWAADIPGFIGKADKNWSKYQK